MKKKKQMLLLTGMLCVMSITVCACGGAKEAAKPEESQGAISEPILEEGAEKNAASQESAADGKGNDSVKDAAADGAGTEESKAGAEGNKAGLEEEGSREISADDGNMGENGEKDQSSGGNTIAAELDTDPDLEGDIKELKDGQLTVIEAIQEKSEDGFSEIIISPGAGGDDSDFNKVTVTYDENTLFAVKTIYDGGARYDLSEATAEDMAAGQFVDIWGSFSGSSLAATRICIIKVDGVSG